MAVTRPTQDAFNRRAFLFGALGATTAGVLAACSGGSSATPTTTTSVAPSAAPPVSAPSSPPAPPLGVPSPAASPAASPAGSPSALASPSASAVAYTLANPPAVANPAQARQYSGQQITYYGDSVGLGNNVDQALAQRFQQDTGIQVNVVPRPANASDSFAQFQRFFQGQSTDMDVLMVDVIWPAQLAQHLVDLAQKLSDEVPLHYANIIQNNTIDGRLVAMPWFADVGMLYYRTDLLQKYGFTTPPATWDDLGTQAQKIVSGEQASNPNLTGYVYQGDAYEGLTCNALEWLASSGGGMIVDDNSQVTVNNPQAAAILNLVKSWVGTHTPRDVSTYQEDDARNVFQGGNAVFMRNWPYAYALGAAAGSPISGKFDAAPLPAQTGSQSAGCVGGQELAVSQYSQHQDAAIELVRYCTSADVQAYRAVVGSYVPTMDSVASRPEVVQAEPFLAKITSVQRVTRPTRQAGDQYNQLSTVFYQGVSQILQGQDASQVLPGVQQQMQRLLS